MNIALSLLQMGPSILQMIVALEGLFPNKAGKSKKAIILASLGTSAPPVVDAAAALIDTTVDELNKNGIFGHAPETAVVPAP